MKCLMLSHELAAFRLRNKRKLRKVAKASFVVLLLLQSAWWQLEGIVTETIPLGISSSYVKGLSPNETTVSQGEHTTQESLESRASSQLRDKSRGPLAMSSRRVVNDLITTRDGTVSSDDKQSMLGHESAGGTDTILPLAVPSSLPRKRSMNRRNRRKSPPTPTQWSTEQLIDIERRAEKQVDAALKNYSACTGRSAYLKLVFSGDLYGNIITNDVDIQALCSQLPTQKRVEELYGPEPIILGLDTCQYYRELLEPEKNNGQRIDPMPRVAGLYHTGTNLLARTLDDNFGKLPRASKVFSGYDVPWGKHLPPATYRLSNTVPKTSQTNRYRVLPIVLIRDPYSWMQAMCKNPYEVVWDLPGDLRCPNLVQPNRTGTYNLTVNTHQTTHQQTDYYNSLPDMWSTWYGQFLDADYPRLIIRFEDAIYRMEQVYETIRECVGAPGSDRPFQFRIDLAKKHGKPTDFLTTLRKFVTRQGSYRGLNVEDRVYSHQALNSTLMKLFQYEYAPLTLEPEDLSGPFDAPTLTKTLFLPRPIKDAWSTPFHPPTENQY